MVMTKFYDLYSYFEFTQANFNSLSLDFAPKYGWQEYLY